MVGKELRALAFTFVWSMALTCAALARPDGPVSLEPPKSSEVPDSPAVTKIPGETMPWLAYKVRFNYDKDSYSENEMYLSPQWMLLDDTQNLDEIDSGFCTPMLVRPYGSSVLIYGGSYLTTSDTIPEQFQSWEALPGSVRCQARQFSCGGIEFTIVCPGAESVEIEVRAVSAWQEGAEVKQADYDPPKILGRLAARIS